MKYNIWSASTYEITNILIDYDPRWKNYWWINVLRESCFLDWVEWKTEQTLKKVDKQIEAIQESMKKEDDLKYVKPVVTEHPPDGSKAHELLGGTLQITAPWYKPKETNLQSNEN
jgi:hypothetical protein